MNDTTLLPLSTTILAVVTTMLTGLFRSLLDRTKTWHPLAVQALAGTVGIVLALAGNYLNVLPSDLQGTFAIILQGVVAAWTAVGINNTKDGVKYGSAGVRKAPDVYTTSKLPDIEGE